MAIAMQTAHRTGWHAETRRSVIWEKKDTSSVHAFDHHVALTLVPKIQPIVFVLDDDISVRKSLEQLIRREGWQPKLLESAEQFIAQPRLPVPSCLILALPLPNPDGLEVQKHIARVRPEIPIIFVSDHEDIRTAVEAMKAGAVEFFMKPYPEEALLGAMRESLERSRTTLDCAIEMHELREDYASLSPRERQVMALVVSGLLNKQVASELGIREITVKVHRGQVMQKMNANSLPDLVMMAAKLSGSYHRAIVS